MAKNVSSHSASNARRMSLVPMHKRSFNFLYGTLHIVMDFAQITDALFGEFYGKLFAEDQLGDEVQVSHNSETRMNIERESDIDEVR